MFRCTANELRQIPRHRAYKKPGWRAYGQPSSGRYTTFIAPPLTGSRDYGLNMTDVQSTEIWGLIRGSLPGPAIHSTKQVLKAIALGADDVGEIRPKLRKLQPVTQTMTSQRQQLIRDIIDRARTVVAWSLVVVVLIFAALAHNWRPGTLNALLFAIGISAAIGITRAWNLMDEARELLKLEAAPVSITQLAPEYTSTPEPDSPGGPQFPV